MAKNKRPTKINKTYDELTIKQQRFVDYYDGNASQAADKAGYSFVETPPKTGNYVYGLVDSLKGDLFYIGKGKGKRMLDHVSMWVNGKFRNAAKAERIDQIFQSGGIVKYLIFHECPEEKEALNIERSLIDLVGRDNLTNIMRVPETQSEKDRVYALYLLSRLKPDDGHRGKHYPLVRKFLTEAVESFGYQVRDVCGHIVIRDRQTIA